MISNVVFGRTVPYSGEYMSVWIIEMQSEEMNYAAGEV